MVRRPFNLLFYARDMNSASRRRGRPPVSTRPAIEATAFELLLRDGYEATTVQAITDAAGVGRTTFFRYFGSKPGVVWAEFDRAIERLRAVLETAPAAEPMSAVQAAVVESTRQSRAASPDSWLNRFRVLDRDPALAGEAASHWRQWAEEISAYVQRRAGSTLATPLAAAIGGAVQAAYVEVLRDWAASEQDDPDLDDLHSALQPLVEAFAVIAAAR
jgi:AcrR family transcriptional regulator